MEYGRYSREEDAPEDVLGAGDGDEPIDEVSEVRVGACLEEAHMFFSSSLSIRL